MKNNIVDQQLRVPMEGVYGKYGHIFIMKWPRYRTVISLEIEIGITSQINKWANTDPPEIQKVGSCV
jgi:hypothetical protein